MFDVLYLKHKDSDNMYSYIIGKITEQYSNFIVVENNKIGYLINVSNPFSFELAKEDKI